MNQNNGILSDISEASGRLLSQLSLIEEMDDVHPSLVDYLKKRRKVLRSSIKAGDNQKLTLLKDMDKILDRTIHNIFNNIFNNIFHRGIAVFFLPGTDESIPYYYGNWEISKDTRQDKKEMEERIDDVEAALKYNEEPLYGSPMQFGTSIPKDILEAEHFFLWLKSHTNLIRPVIDSKDRSYYRDTDKCGYYRNIVWAVPNKETLTLKYWLTKNVEGPSELELTWKCKTEYPLLVGSPVFTNHNSIVAIANYYDEKYFVSDDGTLGLENPEFKFLLSLNNVLAQSLFSPLYNAIQRSRTSKLKDDLKRVHISKSLLETVAFELRPSEKSITYEWGDKKSEMQCADLRSHILDDLWSHSESIFKRVITIEEDIYKKVVEIGRNELRTQLACLKFDIEFMPNEAPFAKLLLAIEQTQRSLRLPKRDHVVHQFQVFLIGLLVLNRFPDLFIETFKKQLERKYPYWERKVKNEDKRREIVVYLLRLAWFLSATYHDIGYPVQEVNKLVDELRGDVGDLLKITKSIIDEREATPLGIEPVIYDDPRTFIFLRHMVELLTEQAKHTDPASTEAWYYFISYLAFKEPHHSMGSVLALGSRLFQGNASSPGNALEFMQNPLVKFLEEYVIFPIMIHHTSDWPNEVKALYNVIGLDKKKFDKLKPDEKGIVTIKRNLLVETLNAGPGYRKTPSIIFDFDSSPIGALLAFCDSLQEVGRPSGSEEKDLQFQVEDHYLRCPSFPDQIALLIMLDFMYLGDELPEYMAHLKDKGDEIELTCSLFKGGFLDKTCVVLRGRWRPGNQAWTSVSENPRIVHSGNEEECTKKCFLNYKD